MAEQKGLPIEPAAVQLTDDERAKKVKALLLALAEIDELEAQKASYAKSKNGEIAKVDERVCALRRVLEADQDAAKQGTLFVDPAAAAKVLAEVHEKSVTEAVDGIVDAATAEAAAEPAPAEPPVPTLDTAPAACPTCNSPVRIFGNSVTCQDSACPWTANLAPSAEAVAERRADAEAWINDESRGGPEAVAKRIAAWWLDFHRTAAFDAAMLSWRATTGAPLMVTEILREEILAAFSLQSTAPVPDCDHAVMAGKKPGRGKRLTCSDCRQTLRECKDCEKHITSREFNDNDGRCPACFVVPADAAGDQPTAPEAQA